MGLNSIFGKPANGTGGDAAVSNGEKPAAPARKSGIPSIISPDLQIVGDLISSGDLQIDGQVQGDIRAATLTVGEAAHVRGSISADMVRVCGSVTGQIHAKRVEMTRSARVTGDIVHEALSIESGAYIDGNCRRMEDKREGAADGRARPEVVNLAQAVPNPLAQKKGVASGD